MTKRSIRLLVTLLILAVLCLCASAASALTVPESADYVERSWNGTQVVSETKTTTAVPVPSNGNMTSGWYILNSNVTKNGRIESITGDVHLILGDGCTLDVKGLYVPAGTTLTIYGQSAGTGRLYSHPSGGAAIGGYKDHDNGRIVIHGGIIDAYGYDNCAGIGSNSGRTGDAIFIYGGNITAKGGRDGAAIGGGKNCSGGDITIYGGTITANGPTDSDTCEDGAGIGGGNEGSGGNIDIFGGEITTYSRDGAGIGGGDGGAGGNITIHGGTITSHAVNNGEGARIGGGKGAYGGDIVIDGGTITADANYGAGIGGGKGCKGGSVTIAGGNITATGTYGIGNGKDAVNLVFVYLRCTDDTKDTISITSSSYNGILVLRSPFRTATDRFFADTVYATRGTVLQADVMDIRALDGSTLVYWDMMTWAGIQETIDAAQDAVTITLDNNVTAGSSDGPLVIPVGKTVTLDLNGCTLDRNYQSTGTYSEGITVYGDLTIEDGSAAGTGMITGCKYGAGVKVRGGSLTLNSGTITGNRSTLQENPEGDTSTGGVDVTNFTEGGETRTGSFTMNGGRITGNQSFVGGGVRVRNHSTFTMNGGTISNNIANEAGGGVIVIESLFTMNGGRISSNTSRGTVFHDDDKISGGGGAVLGHMESARFNLKGGEISGNTGLGSGGAMANIGGIIEMTGGLVKDNVTKDVAGSAIDLAAGTFQMKGGEISGNRVEADTSQTDGMLYGGAVYVRVGTNFEISGSPKVKNNTINSAPGPDSTEYMKVDVLLREGETVDLIGDLTEGAEVYIFPGEPGMVVTKGLSRYGGMNPLQYIKCNEGMTSNPLHIEINTDGEAVIGPAATITYQPNGASGYAVTDTTLEGVTNYYLRENPFTAPAGQAFYHWEIDGAVHYPYEKLVPAGSITANAVWGSDQYYTVSFDAGMDGTSGIMYDVRVEKGSGTASYALPACRYVAPEGYSFVGWLVGSGTEAQPAGTEIELTGDISLTASWSQVANTVSFDSNGGTGIMQMYVGAFGESYTIPECAFSAPQGKQFGGWIMSDGETLYFPGDTITLGNSITLKPYWGSAWAGLQLQLGTASNGSAVTLSRDYAAADGDMALQVPAGKNVILNLNGHTIDRNDPNWTYFEPAIRVYGTLTIRDTSAGQTGRITGGTDSGIQVGGFVLFTETEYPGHLTLESGAISGNPDRGVTVSAGSFTMTGGEICDNEDTGVYMSRGQFTMSGGRIVNNSATRGGGVYLTKYAQGVMTGGEISGNYAPEGGGICLQDADFTLSGGVISSNTALRGGAGIYLRNLLGGGAFRMTGGEITNNTAAFGGGIYAQFSFEISGGTITGNKAKGTLEDGETAGGGIYIHEGLEAQISLSGSPTITGNTAKDGATDNVALRDTILRITGPLTSGARVGVGVWDQNKAAVVENDMITFTSGLNGNGTEANFTSDVPVYIVGLNASGEAALCFDESLRAAAPVISPEGGFYRFAPEVTLTTETEGAVIHYTLDGSIPTSASPVYEGPIAITQRTTVKAIAVKEGLGRSAVTEAEYNYIHRQVTLLPGEADGVTVPGEPIIIDGENPDNWCTIDNIVSGKFMLGINNKVTFIESLDCPFTAPAGYVFASDWERTAREEDGNNAVNGDTVLTLTAVWTTNPYTVTKADLPSYAAWKDFGVDYLAERYFFLPALKLDGDAWNAGIRLAAVVVTDSEGSATEYTEGIDDHDPVTWAYTPGSDGKIEIRMSSYTLCGKDVTVSARFTTAPAAFTLPAGTRTVEANAFEGAAMASVFLPDGCTAIGDYAFKDCAGLTRIRIPAGCALGTDVFDGCGTVYVLGTAGSAAETYCQDHSNCVFVATVE